MNRNYIIFLYVVINIVTKSQSNPRNKVATYLVDEKGFSQILILANGGKVDIINVKVVSDKKLVRIRTQIGVNNELQQAGIAPISPTQSINILVDPQLKQNSRKDFQKEFVLSFENLLPYDELMQFVLTLPTLSTPKKKIEVETIGKSFQGRDIKLVKISNGRSNNNIMFIDCGIHAREWISTTTGAYVLKELTIDKNHSNLDDMDWYIIPTINPDGLIQSETKSRLHRKNMNFADCDPSKCGSGDCGVDLNRNFPYHFGESGISTDTCSEIYGGRSALSEPESQALAKTLQKYGKRIKLYLSLHSFATMLLYPWGYAVKKSTNWKKLEAAAYAAVDAMHRYDSDQRFGVNNSATLYPAAGGSDDYAHGVITIPYAYTMELQGDKNFALGFSVDKKNIKKYLAQNFAGISTLAEYVNNNSLERSDIKRKLFYESNTSTHHLQYSTYTFIIFVYFVLLKYT